MPTLNGWARIRVLPSCSRAVRGQPLFARGIRADLKKLAPHLISYDATAVAAVYAATDAPLKGHPYVKSAVDMACGDLPGKHCGVPVTKLLGGRISAAVPMARTKIKILHTPDAVSGEHPSIKPLTTAREGFSMNTVVLCEAHRRDELERVCRYATRGSIALERLTIDADAGGL
jgi:L-alanine-DL-glutamate epimerase-like enolase superfamily enzyme